MESSEYWFKSPSHSEAAGKWTLRVLALSQQDHLDVVLPNGTLLLPTAHFLYSTTVNPGRACLHTFAPAALGLQILSLHITILILSSLQGPAPTDSPCPHQSPSSFPNLTQLPHG